MKIAEQIQVIISILSTFNPAKQSISNHSRDILTRTKHYAYNYTNDDYSMFTKNTGATGLTGKTCKTALLISESEHAFIMESACGIVYYGRLFDALLDLLYAENMNLNPAYKLHYKVFFNFVFFQLNSTNFKKLKFMLQSLNSTAVLPFLRLIFEKATFGFEKRIADGTRLAQEARTELVKSRFYFQLENVLTLFFSEDHVYKLVETVLDQNYQNAMQMIEELSKIFEFSDEKGAHNLTANAETEAYGFNLTYLKAQVKCQVQIIDNEYKAKPYYADSRTMEQVFNEREKAIEELKPQITVPIKEFDKFVNPAKKLSKQYELPKVQVGRYSAYAVSRTTGSAPPKVAITKAQILRENYLLEKRKKEASEELERFAQGLHDSYEYDSWQQAMLKYDYMQLELHVAQNKLGAKYSLVLAKNSKNLHYERQKAAVAYQNVEHMEQLVEHYEYSEEKAYQLAVQVQTQKEDTKEAVVKAREQIVQENYALKQAIAYEQEKLLHEASDRRMLEQLERADLVNQIKAFLQVSAAERYIKLAERYDPTYTKGVGLLEEMSLVELHERLSEMKKIKSQLENERRYDILRYKEEEKAQLEQKYEEIYRVKHALADVRKQKFTFDNTSIYQRTVQYVSAYADTVAYQMEERGYKQNRQLYKQMDTQASRAREANERLNYLKQKTNAFRQAKATLTAFHANEALERKRTPAAQELDKRARENEANNKRYYNERRKQEEHARVQEMLQTNQEKRDLAARIAVEEMAEKKQLVLAEREQQKEYARKLALENMYKAKAMGKYLDEVFL